MAEVLLITRDDVVKFTAMNGNVDTDNFIQWIKVAQDIHIQNFLGTRLLDKIKTDIENDDLTGDYLSLTTTYIKPMLIHWAMVEYLPFAAYTIANKGVYKHEQFGPKGDMTFRLIPIYEHNMGTPNRDSCIQTGERRATICHQQGVHLEHGRESESPWIPHLVER